MRRATNTIWLAVVFLTVLPAYGFEEMAEWELVGDFFSGSAPAIEVLSHDGQWSTVHGGIWSYFGKDWLTGEGVPFIGLAAVAVTGPNRRWALATDGRILEDDGVFWNPVPEVEAQEVINAYAGGWSLISIVDSTDVWFANRYRYTSEGYELQPWAYNRSSAADQGFSFIEMLSADSGVAIAGGTVHVYADSGWVRTDYNISSMTFGRDRSVWFLEGRRSSSQLWYAPSISALVNSEATLVFENAGVGDLQDVQTDSDGAVWFVRFQDIGRLDPLTGDVEYFTISPPPLSEFRMSGFGWVTHFEISGGVPWLIIGGSYFDRSGSRLGTVSRLLRSRFILPHVAAPEAINFDDINYTDLPAVGTVVRREIYVTNQGEGVLKILGMRTSSAEFRFQPNISTSVAHLEFDLVTATGRVASGDSLRITVAYFPTDAGQHTDTLWVESNDRDNPILGIPLSGATLGSIGPNLETPATVAFDTVLTFEDQSKSIRLRNTGTGLLTVTSVTSDSPVFTVAAFDSLTVRPGEWEDIDIRFAPRDGGFHQGQLVIESDDPATPATVVTLEGEGFQLPEGPITIDFHLAAGDQGRRAAGSATVGKIYLLQLNVADAPEISGWSVKIEFDPTALRYVDGSFTASDFIPALVGLVDDTETGLVSVGGTVLGTPDSRSGDGTLSLLSFEVLDGFQGESQLHITEISFRRTDDTTDKRTVRATATITSVLVDVGLSADFNGDGGVDFDDFFIFADGFGGSDPLVDLNGSGTVDFDDFFIFADQFGQEERAKLMALAETYLGLPRETTLLSIYPNPFNASTVINYSLSAPANVRLDIFDLAGQRIDTLVNGLQIAGAYQMRWDGADVSSGVYVVRLRIGEVTTAQKVTMIK